MNWIILPRLKINTKKKKSGNLNTEYSREMFRVTNFKGENTGNWYIHYTIPISDAFQAKCLSYDQWRVQAKYHKNDISLRDADHDTTVDSDWEEVAMNWPYYENNRWIHAMDNFKMNSAE